MITHGICYSYRLEQKQGIHAFGTDVLKMALFTSSSNIGPGTSSYSSLGECSGAGYNTGGNILTIASTYPKLVSDGNGGYTVVTDIDDLTYSSITTTTRGGLIYNASKDNRAIAVIDFGQDVVVDGDLIITWPLPTIASAIMRSR